MNSFKPCFVIPNYNHSEVFEELLLKLIKYRLPIIIVNDGSNDFTRELLESLANRFADVELLSLAENSGKGAAVIAGMKLVYDYDLE